MPSFARASTQEQAGPVERIARIAGLIEESGSANEALGSLLPDVVDALHEQRLFHMLLPRTYGGEEVDLVTLFRALEALGRLDASAAWCVGQINGCAATASGMAPVVARKIWSEPRAALSWGPPGKTRAEEVDGGHRVTGQWMMSSGSAHATWVGLMAPVFDRAGAPVALPAGVTTRVFLVPVSEVEFVGDWNVVGLRATNSRGFKADNLFVPHGFSVLHHHDMGAHVDSTLYRFSLLNLYAIAFSAVALGAARAMLDSIIKLAIEKKPRFSELTLRDNHHVQFQIGEAEARLRSARSFVETTVQQAWDAVAATGSLSRPHYADIRMAATFAIHEAKAVAGVAWEIAGATSIFASGPFERRWRDINTITQQLQGRKSHLQDVGAYLLGLDANLQ
jgi:alkylation response protein AidB-like acyl-CoA dehydrogenase